MKLILLPGLDGTGELFGPFIEALHGFPTQVVSYPPDRAMSYAEHEVFARDKLPIDDNYLILAESFSGPIGISIAATAPSRLKGLILCGTFAANPLPIFSPLRGIVGKLPAVRIPPPLMAPWLFGRRGTPELRRAHAHAMSLVSPAILRARVAAILSVDHRPLLRRITVPMMYMRAMGDLLVPKAAGRAILQLRSDIELAEIDAPHFLLQTEPEACVAVVMSFIRRHIDVPAAGGPAPGRWRRPAN
jgi:pimeloyl-[acyl-carrier protein] methyl ester esterase